jgi:hydroxypyruvate isomerase
MNRRDFAKGAALATTALGSVATAAAQNQAAAKPGKFRLKYGPHPGMFKNHAGDDYINQLKFAADEGFTAWEDNDMMKRPIELQEKAAKAMADLGITMGVFVAQGITSDPLFAKPTPQKTDALLQQMQKALETAKRVNATWMTVVPGNFTTGLEWDYQTANVIDTLKRCAEIFEPHGKVMVLEPLNAWKDHPGCFLTKVPQAYQICKAVGSPACKILDDFYHQQITEGNLLPNLEMAWSEIAYVQVGDNPGRCEPGTGEVNYKNLFKRLHQKGYQGVIGMEHGNSKPGKEGERAVIDAYRAADAF